MRADKLRMKALSFDHKLDIHIPQCTDDGRYIPMQCTELGRECWCVDDAGVIIPGTDIMHEGRNDSDKNNPLCG